MRTFTRTAEGFEVQNFLEWTGAFETLLERILNPIKTEFSRNHYKHLDLLNKIIDLRNDFGRLLDNYYLEAYENLLIQVNGKYLRYAPLMVRKGGKVPIHSEVAKLLILGIEISREETGNFLKFNEYYLDGLKNGFYLKERAVFFGDDVASRSSDYYDLVNLFPFDFPPVNKDAGIEERIKNLKVSLQAGVGRDGRDLQEMIDKLQKNTKKIEYINKISADPYFMKLSNRGLLRLKL